MKRRVLAVDCDDVLVLWTKRLAVWHNETYGTSLQYSDYFTYPDFRTVWGVSQEEAVYRVNEFARLGHLDRLEVTDGAREALESLSRIYEPHVVTARSSTQENITRRHIGRHFPDIFSNVHFASHNDADRRCKGDICRELNAYCIIDDSLDNILACSNVVEIALLFDAPWNQNVLLPHNCQRVVSWVDVSKILSE